jgi:large subunit ribosomal protein L6
MSLLGSRSIVLPTGVTVAIVGRKVTVKGPKGELTLTLSPEVSVIVEGPMVTVKRRGDDRRSKEFHGLTRALLANMVRGVTEGCEVRLEVLGIGYRAQAKGRSVTLSLGFSHPVEYTVPAGVEVLNDQENKQVLIVRGIDKQLVGQVAADIRNLRPPEPYKGKGIRYVDEVVRRKVGKAAVKTTAA